MGHVLVPRGGPRNGAGRPRVLDDLQRKTVYLDQQSIELVEFWGGQRQLGFSAALRWMLDTWQLGGLAVVAAETYEQPA